MAVLEDVARRTSKCSEWNKFRKWKPIFKFPEMTSAWQGFASCGPIIWLCWCKCIPLKQAGVKTQYNTAANCKHVFLSVNSAILTIGITNFKHWQRLGRISVPISVRHYCDVIIGAMASQITNLTIACSTVCSGAYQRQIQSSASLAFVRGIHR